MEDHKPEWYAKARKGPFGNKKFTMRHADNVIRRIQEDQQRAESYSGKRLPVQLLAVASFIVLLGLGVFFLNGRFLGNESSNPAQTEVSSHFTEAELQRNADQVMQSLLGKTYPLDHREWLKEQQQIFYSYQKDEDSAYIWIDYETGELVQTKMSAMLTTAEIDAEMKTRAEEIKGKLGYANDSAYDVLRYVEYDAKQHSGVKIENNFRAEKWRIGFVNGEFDYASATLEASAVSEETRQAGEEALKILRGTGGDEELSLVFRAMDKDQDTFTLQYGSKVSVTFDTVTRRIEQISDTNPRASDKTDPKQLTVLDRELSLIDGDRLREKAAPLLTKIFSVADVGEYSLLKRDQEPGNLTFHKLGSPEITVYYDSDLTIWKVKEDLPASQS
ncbi:hypothetical protein CD191_24870 [Paenibacillus odorifer]|uniref:Uncharacterized protein n=2 Tax=Paenibacillus odorifer TaxID=189426 RepID=A0AAD0P315_9BACL|nr:hypothetical protein [Paenibacillus odorifer]AWV35607.1 hypothetical protein CD191_24870 [Paenibacillus odorifer]